MMKKILKYCLIGAISIGLSSSCLALTINDESIDVGDLDTLISVEELANSGDATESDWISTVLGIDYTITKVEDLEAVSTDENADWLAVELLSDDLYYLIKNSTYTALFENTDELLWAVFDTTQDITVVDAEGNEITDTFSTFFNLSANNLEISHISTASVPEPSTLALLSVGLLGLGFARRKH